MPKTILIILLTLGAVAVAGLFLRRLLGFGAQNPDDYSDTAPAIDLRHHLNGPIACEGIIYGPTGRVASRFNAQMFGEWKGASGSLAEDFTYADGSTQSRKWFIKQGNGAQFTATADDIIGTATGETSGSTIQMKYRIRLPKDAGGHVLSVTDWIYLTENGVMMNRSVMRKFGIKVAELVATMRPADEEVLEAAQ